jgi:two-component system sensor histidine kinase PhoQ
MNSAAFLSSLSGRLIASVLLLLVIFFGVTIAGLDLVFRNLSERNLRDLLDAQITALIADSDADERGDVRPPRHLAERRLEQPGSGLYAEIQTEHGEPLWSSPSMLGTHVDFGKPVATGERRQERRRLADGSEVMALSAGLHWELQPGANRNFIFRVATNLAPYEAQLHRFRVQLFGWFFSVMALLLVSLGLLLRWVLRPLRQIEREIGEVEVGKRTQLGTSLPRELVGLAENMNALLASERRRVERYRNTLGNLAHSLKTPLAVVRATLSVDSRVNSSAHLSAKSSAIGDGDDKTTLINQQIDRMNAIVQHQLKRAAASGGALVGQAAVDMGPVLIELRAALSKVYAHKDLLIEIEAGVQALFAGDRGDLLELAGNLLDNACKWCRTHVRVTVRRQPRAGAQPQLLLTVEDDGAGIAVRDRQRMLERGARADEATPGQGLGLAMVREIVQLYGGELEISDSELGGARVCVRLPGR